MNLMASISVYAGGAGSGCRGPNCGRPKIRGEEDLSGRHKKALAKVPDSHLKGLHQFRVLKMPWVGEGGSRTPKELGGMGAKYGRPTKSGEKPEVVLHKGTTPQELLHELGHHVFYERLPTSAQKAWNSMDRKERGWTTLDVGGKYGADPREQWAQGYSMLMQGHIRPLGGFSDQERLLLSNVKGYLHKAKLG